MDSHPSGTGIQQNPNSCVHHLYHNFHYSSAQSQNPNPNPDPNYSANSVEVSLAYAYTQSVVVGSGSTATPAYYPDPNAAAITPFRLNPYASAVTIPSTGDCKFKFHLMDQPEYWFSKGSIWEKGPKKIKVVKSAWCEICRVDFNSKNVLDQHKLGKKHKNNLEKLIAPNTSLQASAPVSAPIPPASTVSNNPVIGPQENPDKAKPAISQKAHKRAADVEDLETRRKKILDGGAAAVDAVRTCTICNVVCYSETVFRYHLAGQKHAAMMKKHTCATGVAAAT